jgi:Methyltransferase domain
VGFETFLGNAALDVPERLTTVASWHEHVPFAFWCIEMLRPRVLVELGTHRGDSYCAFCQAVDRHSPSTRCFAVDTWKGEAHSGVYGEDVFEELRAYHDRRFGRFSSLVRSTFDEAVSHFADGSIDLLHVDGLHTYDAVKHDFETWLPKLSRAGVVLFHDTNVRERDFGVWRFWEEVRARHPHFEFLHGHGLGVLVVGEDPPEAARWMGACEEDGAEGIRRLFARLGAAVSHVHERRGLVAENGTLREELVRTGRELERTGREVEELRANATELRSELTALRSSFWGRFAKRGRASPSR